MNKDKDALSVTPLDAAKVALGVAKVLVKASPISQVSILVDTAELILKIIEQAKSNIGALEVLAEDVCTSQKDVLEVLEKNDVKTLSECFAADIEMLYSALREIQDFCEDYKANARRGPLWNLIPGYTQSVTDKVQGHRDQLNKARERFQFNRSLEQSLVAYAQKESIHRMEKRLDKVVELLTHSKADTRPRRNSDCGTVSTLVGKDTSGANSRHAQDVGKSETPEASTSRVAVSLKPTMHRTRNKPEVRSSSHGLSTHESLAVSVSILKCRLPQSPEASTSSKPTASRTKNKPELPEASTLSTVASIKLMTARTRDKLELRAAPLTKPITAGTRNNPKIGPKHTSVSKRNEDHSTQGTDSQGGHNTGKSSSKVQQQAEEVVLATRTSGNGHKPREEKGKSKEAPKLASSACKKLRETSSDSDPSMGELKNIHTSPSSPRKALVHSTSTEAVVGLINRDTEKAQKKRGVDSQIPKAVNIEDDPSPFEIWVFAPSEQATHPPSTLSSSEHLAGAAWTQWGREKRATMLWDIP